MEVPFHWLPAFMPKRLLLERPVASRGTWVPQLVSSAACAMRLRGSTPSCWPACRAAGQRSLMKLSWACGEGAALATEEAVSWKYRRAAFARAGRGRLSAPAAEPAPSGGRTPEAESVARRERLPGAAAPLVPPAVCLALGASAP